jgi:hypothetical protein
MAPSQLHRLPPVLVAFPTSLLAQNLQSASVTVPTSFYDCWPPTAGAPPMTRTQLHLATGVRLRPQWTTTRFYLRQRQQEPSYSSSIAAWLKSQFPICIIPITKLQSCYCLIQRRSYRCHSAEKCHRESGACCVLWCWCEVWQFEGLEEGSWRVTKWRYAGQLRPWSRTQGQIIWTMPCRCLLFCPSGFSVLFPPFLLYSNVHNCHWDFYLFDFILTYLQYIKTTWDDPCCLILPLATLIIIWFDNNIVSSNT